MCASNSRKDFLITGAIRSSADVQSDSSKRLAQTIESIQALRSVRPDSHISYLDSSGASLDALKEALGDDEDISLHPILKAQNVQIALAHLDNARGVAGSGLRKSLLEVATYRTYFQEIVSQPSPLELTKISGRYSVSRDFRLDLRVLESPAARVLRTRSSYLRPKHAEYPKFTRTVAWSIFGKQPQWLDELFGEVESILIKAVFDATNLDLEHAFLKVLLSSGLETRFESRLRVAGEVASTGRMIRL